MPPASAQNSTKTDLSIADRKRMDEVTDRSIHAPPIKPGFEQFHSTEILKNSMSRLHKEMVLNLRGENNKLDLSKELEVTQERFKDVMDATEYLPEGTMREVAKGLDYLENLKGADSIQIKGRSLEITLRDMNHDLENAIESKLEAQREEVPSRSMRF